jgi:hypothetical protein
MVRRALALRETELVVGRALAAEHAAQGDVHAPEQLRELCAGRGRLQVLDDARLLAAVSDEREDVREVAQSGSW